MFEPINRKSASTSREDAADVDYAALVDKNLALVDKNFWRSIQYCLNCTRPLVKILQLCLRGFGQRHMKTNFKKIYSICRWVWEIIDQHWKLQLHIPLCSWPCCYSSESQVGSSQSFLYAAKLYWVGALAPWANDSNESVNESPSQIQVDPISIQMRHYWI